MGERIKVHEADVVPGSGPPGIVADDHLKIACGKRAVKPTVVQRAGRSRMHPDELLRGGYRKKYLRCLSRLTALVREGQRGSASR